MPPVTITVCCARILQICRKSEHGCITSESSKWGADLSAIMTAPKHYKKGAVNGQWGRKNDVDWFESVYSIGMVLCMPFFMMAVLWMCQEWNCEVFAPIAHLLQHGPGNYTEYVSRVITQELDSTVVLVFVGWMVLQVVLEFAVPSPTARGPRTPDGVIPDYNVGGMRTWLISHGLWFAAIAYWGMPVATYVYDKSGPLIFVSNIYGLVVPLLLYIKGRMNVNGTDRLLSGSAVYDYLMGIELHPRIGKLDLKMFHNSRAGMFSGLL